MIVLSDKGERLRSLRRAVADGFSQGSIRLFERNAWRAGATADETSEAIALGAADFAASFEVRDEPRDTVIP